MNTNVEKITVPCPDKLSLLTAFCSKVRDLHMASTQLATLVLSNVDARDLKSAKARCEKLWEESGVIRRWYDQHDFDCPSCRQLTLQYRAQRFQASA
jgi:hypothetical protein